MKNRLIFTFIVLLLCEPILASDVTPEEVFNKVKEAYYFLNELKQPGITVFNDRNGQFTWKSTYVFVLNCHSQTIIAHPRSRSISGTSFAHYKDKKGSRYMRKACRNTNAKFGNWVEYWWQKKGEEKLSRRIMYMITVPGVNLQVAAGIYNKGHSLDDLKKINY